MSSKPKIQDAHLHIKLSQQLKDDATRLARIYDDDVSAWVRELLRREIKKHEKRVER